MAGLDNEAGPSGRPAPAVSAASELKANTGRLAASVLGVSMAAGPLYSYTAGIFIQPLERQFGWSRVDIALAGTLFSLTLALSGYFAGLLLDRFGTRLVATSAALLTSVGFLLLANTPGDLLTFLGTWIFIAFVGGGTTAITFVRMVVRAFEAHRGLAIGITMSGTGIAGAALPILVSQVVAHSGWRQGYMALGALALLPIPLLLICGTDRVAADAPLPDLEGLSLRQALRTHQFWAMGLIFALASAALPGLLPHLVPILQMRGFTATNAGSAVGLLGLAVIGGRLLTGFALDRFAPRMVTSLIFVAACTGWIAILYGSAPVQLLGLILLGSAIGAEVDIAGYLTALFFGRRHYGAIFGLEYGFFTVGGALAPVIAARFFDVTGNYVVPIQVAMAMLVANIVFVNLLRMKSLVG